MSTAIKLENINFDYGANSVLKDFSLTVKGGELIALLGVSGGGKTTILKIIAGLLEQDSGEVWLDDENISKMPAELRQTAMVFQKPLLFPFLSIAENVAFGLKMRGLPKPEIKEKVAQTLRLVKLEGFENRSAKQLSGGQEQRVALARALVTNPRVLLLDEPFSALDAQLRTEMRNMVVELQQQLKITTLFVTHDQEEAVSIADRIAFLENGKPAQTDVPKEFFVHPQTSSIAEFFGWKILTGKRNGKFLETSAGNIDVSRFTVQFSENDFAEIGFHPNRAKLAINNQPMENGEIFLCGKLNRIIEFGTKSICLLSFSDGEQIAIEISENLANSEFENLIIGEDVKFFIPPNALIFFKDRNATVKDRYQ